MEDADGATSAPDVLPVQRDSLAARDRDVASKPPVDSGSLLGDGPLTSCTGGACACAANQTCRFECPSTAGVCSVSCQAESVCSTTGVGGANLTCGDSSDCRATAGQGSVVNCKSARRCVATVGVGAAVTCDSAQLCAITAGSGSSVTCDQATDCQVRVGANSSVTGGAKSCDVTCEGACTVQPGSVPCRIQCASPAGCAVSCGTGTGPAKCTGGSVVCGGPC